MKKSVVVYYSFEGSTKKIAELIAKTTNSDIIVIEPLKELKSKGFSKYIWGGKDVVMGKKPPIKSIDTNFNDYDLIFLGSPTWVSTYAPPVKTFIDELKVSGKDIAYFYSHEGGHKKVVENTALAIEPKNNLIAFIDCMNVKTDYAKLEQNVMDWAEELTK